MPSGTIATASKCNILSAMVFGILLVGSSSVSAAPITFDFEELALGGSTGVPSVTSTPERTDADRDAARRCQHGHSESEFLCPCP